MYMPAQLQCLRSRAEEPGNEAAEYVYMLLLVSFQDPQI